MSTISIQLSLYPLRQPHLGPAIGAALEAFRARGLDGPAPADACSPSSPGRLPSEAT
jgi:hypothetical protein